MKNRESIEISVKKKKKKMSRTGILFVVKDLEMGGGCRQAGRKKIPGIFRLEEIVDRKKISTRRVLGEGGNVTDENPFQ